MSKKYSDGDNILHNLLKLWKKLGRMPLMKEIYENEIVMCSRTLKSTCLKNGYDDYKDFCRKHGYGHKNDVFISGEYKSISTLILEDYVVLWGDFKQKHGRFPTMDDLSYRKRYGYNLPPQNRFDDMLNENNITLNDFKELIGDNNIYPDVNLYDEYIRKYKAISNKRDCYLKYNDLTNNNYGLPDARWLIAHRPNKSVKNYNHFVEWCGFVPQYEVSKELATLLILQKSKELNRPLMKDDFTLPTTDEVGMGTIIRIWGSFNDMKKDLNLEVIQESPFKDITLEKVEDDLINVCNQVCKKENRKTVNTSDIKKYGEYSYSTYNKYFKNNNQSMNSFLETIGFAFQQSGTGISTTFDDGEITLSQFETAFSRYLRENLCYKYDTDYFRDVRYSSFISDYEGFMDCDYIIHHKNKVIYIEIAGILRDYKDWYYKDKKILSSNSKEQYRLSLKEKEKMLKENNLECYIIFPQDCNEEFFNAIFNKEGEING